MRAIHEFVLNKNTSETIHYIRERLNMSDPRVKACKDSESLKTLPPWYRLEVAMIKCVTSENDTVRCDDFRTNSTLIEDVKSKVKDQVSFFLIIL